MRDLTEPGQDRAPPPTAAPVRPATRTWHPVLLAAGLLDVAVAAWQSYGRAWNETATDITVAWLTGLALLLAAAGPLPRDLRARLAAVRWRPSAATVAGLAIVAVAAGLRLVSLHRFPSVVDGDEGALLMTARLSRHGRLGDPYVSSFLGNPDGYRALQGVVSRPFPDSIASYRLTSALVGTTSVAATWRLGRRLLGDVAGLAGAAVLAVLPLHLWASRSGLNDVVDAAALAGGLALLARALDTDHPRDALLAGGVFGLGLYGYFGAAAFPLVVLAWLVLALVLPSTRTGLRSAVRTGAWLAVGLVGAAAPLLGWWAAHPAEATSRVRTVSAATASPGLLDRVGRIPRAVARPFLEAPAGFYRSPAPSIGWVAALLAALGLAAWLVWTTVGLRAGRAGDDRRPRPEPLLLAWVLLAAGIAQTDGVQSQRFVGSTVLWALAAGTGARVVGQVAGSLGCRAGPLLAGTATAALVVVGGATNADRFFDTSQVQAAYSDPATTGAHDLGWRLDRTEEVGPVTVVSAHGFSWHGFFNAQFLAPDVGPRVTDVADLAAEEALAKLGPSGLVILAGTDTDADRCRVEARYPDSTATDAVDRTGLRLYTAIRLGPGTTLESARTPAGTELRPAPALDCSGP